MSDELPVIPGEVVGWRAWRVRVDWRGDVVLTSIWNDDEWPTGDWMRATCRRSHRSPDERCSCGIYVARTPELLVKLRYNDASYGGGSYRYGRNEEVRAVGQVGLAGKIIPGERTFRAERGRVVRLWLPFDKWELAQPLADAYRVPVRLGNIIRFEREVADVVGHGHG